MPYTQLQYKDYFQKLIELGVPVEIRDTEKEFQELWPHLASKTTQGRLEGQWPKLEFKILILTLKIYSKIRPKYVTDISIKNICPAENFALPNKEPVLG